MFPRSSPAGYLNVNGNLTFSKPLSRINIYASGSRAELRTLFTAPQGQNTVFGAMPGPGGPGLLSVVQVYSTNLDPMPPAGFRYGDFRIGTNLGQFRISSSALGPDSSSAGQPTVFPLCFFVNGHSTIFNTNAVISFSDGAAQMDAAGNLGLGGVTPAARLQLGQGGALQFDRPDGTNSFQNVYIANDLNLVWTFNAGANIMKLQNDGTLIANYMITATLTATSLVLGGNTITSAGNGGVMQRIAQVVCAGSQATVDFSSIPPGFSALLILSQSRDTTAGTSDSNVFMRFNGDTTAGNYDAPEAIAVTGTAVAGAQPATTTNGFAILTHPNAGATVGRGGIGRIEIPNYAGTSFFKQAMGQSYEPFATAATSVSMYLRGGQWKSAAAINQITLIAGTAFQNNSVFTLLGIP